MSDSPTIAPADAAGILAAIRSGALTAEKAVADALDKAKSLTSLNAIIYLDREGALAAARHIDDARASGAQLGPLAGLPIVVKDNINTAAMPTSGGTPALRNVRPTSNAPSLQKLLDAGAIVIGKANMHELAFGITSTNLSPFAGVVHNPYDTTRIPGGSSGGTAAAVAAGIVTCGLGTDTGGSTRVPAALTGIVGLRPSVGNGGAERRYHNDGAVVPISRTRDTVGPMGRSVADVALLDSVIAGTPVPTPAKLAGLRLAVPPSLWDGLEDTLRPVVREARAKLAAAGVEFVEAEIEGLFDLNNKISFVVALHEPAEDIPAYLAATGVSGITIADVAAGVASPDVRGAFEAILADAFKDAYPEAMTVHRPALQKLYADYFAAARVDAILFPTTIAPAPVIDRAAGSAQMSVNGGPPADTFATMIRNTDPASNAGLPGLSLYAGMTGQGLPVGLEIDGPVGSDSKLLSIGLAIEQVLGLAPAPKL